MGKMKKRLEEDMMMHPELYDGSNEYEFWMHCVLEEKNKPTKKKRRPYVRRKKKS